jgi:hypothetical protein
LNAVQVFFPGDIGIDQHQSANAQARQLLRHETSGSGAAHHSNGHAAQQICGSVAEGLGVPQRKAALRQSAHGPDANVIADSHYGCNRCDDGVRLHERARGIDKNEVMPDRPTQSISVEDTFEQDVL